MDAKQYIRDDSFSDPLLNYVSARMARSRTIEVESSKWQLLPLRILRRAATDLQQTGPRPSLYPALVSDRGIREEPSKYHASPPRLEDHMKCCSLVR